MEGTAVLGRVTWHTATVVGLHDETATARTLTLAVHDWPGHVAGQHVDLRLTAADGYSAVRSYSLASAPSLDGPIEITVERLPDGEVSPYLTQQVMVGDELEVRGPIGRWFVWRPEQVMPIQLVAGGSGIVPLMAMIRSRTSAGSTAPFRLLYSVREPGAIYYHDELRALSSHGDSVVVTYAYTRVTPKDWPRPAGRIDAEVIASGTWPSNTRPSSYVCGPTSFVERVTDLLIAAGHDRERIQDRALRRHRRTKMSASMNYLDGNAAAGELSRIFATDLTSAQGQCAHCGATRHFAEAHLYMKCPGIVARCAGCGHVLLRLVNAGGRLLLDLRGMAYLALDPSEFEDSGG